MCPYEGRCHAPVNSYPDHLDSIRLVEYPEYPGGHILLQYEPDRYNGCDNRLQGYSFQPDARHGDLLATREFAAVSTSHCAIFCKYRRPFAILLETLPLQSE